MTSFAGSIAFMAIYDKHKASGGKVSIVACMARATQRKLINCGMKLLVSDASCDESRYLAGKS